MPRFAKPCLERTYTQAPHAQTAVVGIESRPALSTGDFHVWIPSGELCAGGAFILLRKHLQEEAVLFTRQPEWRAYTLAQLSSRNRSARPALLTGDLHAWIRSGVRCAGGAFIALRKHLQEEAVLSTRASRSCALHIRGGVQKGATPPIWASFCNEFTTGTSLSHAAECGLKNRPTDGF